MKTKIKAVEANRQLIQLLMKHCQLLQGGKFGETDLNDLEFCGLIHGLIEDSQKYIKL